MSSTVRQRKTKHNSTNLALIDNDQSHPAPEDEDLESDVSDMELSGWKPSSQARRDDVRTSDRDGIGVESVILT